MSPVRLLPMALGLLLFGLVLGGCVHTGPGEASGTETGTVRAQTIRFESDMYVVEIEQWDRNGVCDRRNVLFRSHSKLYTKPHVDRVRAVDVGCDATNITAFEQFEVMRSPNQQHQYLSDFWFRNRIDEDLWYAYQNALFRGVSERA